MSEASHSSDDHNSEKENKPFAKKFIFPVLLIAVLFYVFTLITKKDNGGHHGDSHSEPHATEATDGHTENDGEDHDHEH